MDGWRAVSTDRCSEATAAARAREAVGMAAMVAAADHPAITPDVDDSRVGSAFVLEADLQLDPVLDDLAVLDDRARLHDLDGLDVADRARGGGDGLAGRVGPRARARADHLADDDHGHARDLLGLTMFARRLRPCAGQAGTGAGAGAMSPARTLSKQLLQ